MKGSEDTIQEVLSSIEKKVIYFPNETINFGKSDWLTPALWLDVPKVWKNKWNA
jgi:hypothetical protein